MGIADHVELEIEQDALKRQAYLSQLGVHDSAGIKPALYPLLAPIEGFTFEEKTQLMGILAASLSKDASYVQQVASQFVKKHEPGH